MSTLGRQFEVPSSSVCVISSLEQPLYTTVTVQTAFTDYYYCLSDFSCVHVCAYLCVCVVGFACLASQYVAELSCGRTPCIETVVTSAAQQVNAHLLKDCAALYSQNIEKEVAGKLPVESEDELRAMHERCEKSAHQLLRQRAMVVDVDSDLGQKLTVSPTN